MAAIALAGSAARADDGAIADASVDRGLIVPSAVTPPAGALSATIRQPTLGLGQVAVGVAATDRIAIGAGALWSTSEATATAHLAVNVFRRPALAITALAGGWYDGGGADTLAYAGAVVTVGLGRERGARLSLAAVATASSRDRVSVSGGAALVVGRGPVRLVGELGHWRLEDAFSSAFVGARWLTHGLAIDGCLLGGIDDQRCQGGCDGPEVVPFAIPMVAVSARL